MPRILAVLKPPKRHNDFLFFARSIAEKCPTSPYLPSPFPPLAPLVADIALLENAGVVVASGLRGAASARLAQRLKVMNNLELVRVSVQRVADPYPDVQAIEVITSAGLSVKKTSAPKPKGLFYIRQTGRSGEVVLERKAPGGPTTYEWQYRQGANPWVDIQLTVVAKTTVSGLTVSQIYFFRSRVTTSAGPTDWCDPLSLIVV